MSRPSNLRPYLACLVALSALASADGDSYTDSTILTATP